MLNNHFLVFRLLLFIVCEWHIAKLNFTSADTRWNRISWFFDRFINFKKLKHQLYVGHGLPDESPKSSEKVEGCIHLEEVCVDHDEISNFERIVSNDLVISYQQSCYKADGYDRRLNNIQYYKGFCNYNVFFLIYSKCLHESILFMSLSIKILDSFEV